jgi:long-subunit acyl-CoA synthetase (AMP-forming)
VKPTLFLGVPRVWEKIMEKMKKIGASTTGTKLAIAKWSKAKGLEHARACNLGGDGHFPPMYGIADTLVLSKVKLALGLEHCKVGLTGAAPITVETLEYFGALGIQINEVYGMSECTGATTWSSDETHLWGSCGFAMPGTEVCVLKVDDVTGAKSVCPPSENVFTPTEAEQGELCYRGRNVMMGYLANPELGKAHVAEIKKKTEESVDADGWLHSGDKGCMSEHGMFKITGRYKELIIGAGGENIAPVRPHRPHAASCCVRHRAHSAHDAHAALHADPAGCRRSRLRTISSRAVPPSRT